MTASPVSHRVTTVADALTGASKRIAAVSDSPGLDAELLLAQGRADIARVATARNR